MKNAGYARNTRNLFGADHGCGKGDTPRPVDRRTYEANYDGINWAESTTSTKVNKDIIKTENKLTIRYKNI